MHAKSIHRISSSNPWLYPLQICLLQIIFTKENFHRPLVFVLHSASFFGTMPPNKNFNVFVFFTLPPTQCVVICPDNASVPSHSTLRHDPESNVCT